jgi:glutaredoxin 3
MIHIYGKPQCPYCTKAKSLAERAGFAYTYYELGKEFELPDLMGLFPNAKTFPQIHEDGYIIGGCDQFQIYLDNGAPYTNLKEFPYGYDTKLD